MSAAAPRRTKRFDPGPLVPIHELPEGILRKGLASRLVRRGESAYDPLWRYLRKVDRLPYLGQGAQIRFGEYDIGMRTPNRIPTRVDFAEELITVGRKVVIPFNSLRGLMVAHGLMPRRTVPVFAVLIKVDGCDSYVPLHRCQPDETTIDLAEFLAKRLRVPLGVASRPLGFLVNPGSARILHARGETPLFELRTVLSTLTPDGRARVRLLAGGEQIPLVEEPDPLGWYERWGIIVGDLLGIVARRAKSKYGRGMED
ncbi:MAG: hypothetical protein JRF63_03890 [Deltaproteobacteria bacterium]|nr:hypothetical protein [Deltaproteobacteria bacterium]